MVKSMGGNNVDSLLEEDATTDDADDEKHFEESIQSISCGRCGPGVHLCRGERGRTASEGARGHTTR